MPVNKNALYRYLCIDRRLRKKPFPTLGDLKSFCEAEFKVISDKKVSVSKETLKADINNLRNIFSVPIEYNSSANHYYYNPPVYTFLSLPEDILERLLHSLQINYLFEPKSKLSDLIQFEAISNYGGWEHIPVIFKSIQEQKIIKFSYKSINNFAEKVHFIHPYLLKESRTVWYLLGIKEGETEIRTFALHRILSKPEITEKKAIINPDFKAENYFSQVIGITAQTGKPISIVLKAHSSQSQYLKAKPIHKTQRIITDSENEFVITITVEPTFELIASILSYGALMEVIAPENFRDIIADKIEASLNNYRLGK